MDFSSSELVIARENGTPASGSAETIDTADDLAFFAACRHDHAHDKIPNSTVSGSAAGIATDADVPARTTVTASFIPVWDPIYRIGIFLELTESAFF